MMHVKKPKAAGQRTISPKRRRWRIALISTGAALAVLVAGVGVYALSLALRFDSAIKIDDVFPDDSLRPPVAEIEGAAAQNILLLGSDTHGSIGGTLVGAQGTRSDTMMILHIPADRESMQVMSLMRDFWVDIPGHGKAKLNAALAYGGIPLVVQTIEGIIDSRIDHVAIVDFKGFEGITNALGGVTIDNPIAFSATNRDGQHFAKGPIKLDGAQALTFVRERHAFVDGDYQRVRNQQLFIRGVMRATLSRETLTNPVTISNLVSAIAPFIAVDRGLDSRYAIALGFELRDLRVDDVRFFTMPTLGVGREGSQSIVKVNWDEVPKIQAAFRNDTLDEYVPPTRP